MAHKARSARMARTGLSDQEAAAATVHLPEVTGSLEVGMAHREVATALEVGSEVSRHLQAGGLAEEAMVARLRVP